MPNPQPKCAVWKTLCRNGYRCCSPVWHCSLPGEDSWFSFEFDTWAEAMDCAHRYTAREQAHA